MIMFLLRATLVLALSRCAKIGRSLLFRRLAQVAAEQIVVIINLVSMGCTPGTVITTEGTIRHHLIRTRVVFIPFILGYFSSSLKLRLISVLLLAGWHGYRYLANVASRHSIFLVLV